jgi:phage terminase large subunit-like protein
MKRKRKKAKFKVKPFKPITFSASEVKKHTETWAKITPNGDEYLAKGCYFDYNAARKVAYFFRTYLRHCMGKLQGKPFDLLRWQKRRLIYPAFGWKNTDGTRAIRTVFLYIPKKNGKSTLCAAILLYLLIYDGEPAANVFAAAGDKEQAGIIFEEVVKMVYSSPILKQKLLVRESYKWILHKKSRSRFRALSSEAKTKEGLNAHAHVVDEIHILPNEDLVSTLRYSGRARSQPIAFYVTTAGNDIHKPWYTEYKYAKKVLAGTVKDTRYLPIIYEIAEGENPEDTALWPKANPSLGHIFTFEDMYHDYLKAKETPSEFASFLRYLLNFVVQDAHKALDSRIWMEAKEEDSNYLLKQDCYGGLDLASTRDLCAFALVFPFTDFYSSRFWFWAPKHIRQNREREVIKLYDKWANEGFLKYTDSEVADYDVIFNDIMEINSLFNVKQIAVDKSHNAMHIIPRLQKEKLKVLGFSQSIFSYNSPCKYFEVEYVNKRIRHDGNPIMAWNIDNVVWKKDDYDRVMPSRETSTEKIDGFVALMMALSQAMQDVDGISQLKKRGIAYV